MITPLLPPQLPITDFPSLSLAGHPIEQLRAALSQGRRSHGGEFVYLLDRAMTTPQAMTTLSVESPMVHDRQVLQASTTDMTLGDFIASIEGGGQRPLLPHPAVPAPRSGWAAGLPPAGRRWADEIEAAAAKAGVDPRLLAALVWVESGFQPDGVSSAGAVGLTQLMPATAAGLGVEPTDPIANLDGGARFLRAMLDQFGSDQLALAAYNAGPTRVAAAGDIPDIAPVRVYVDRVLEYAGRLGYPIPVIPLGEGATPEANNPMTGAVPAASAGTNSYQTVTDSAPPHHSEPVGTEVTAGENVETGTADAMMSGSAPTRKSTDLAGSRPGMSGAVERLAQTVEKLQSGPPPRRMWVELPELGGIRVSVTLRNDAIQLDMGRTGGDSEGLERDLAAALRERGFDLSEEDEPRQPHEEPIPVSFGHHQSRPKRSAEAKTPGWLL